MTARLTGVAILLGLWLGAVAPAAAQTDPVDLVEQFLRDHGATGGYTIAPVTDDYVVRTFPTVSFFGVRFRQYPVAFLVPDGFSASNVVAVIGDEVVLFTDSAQFRDFFLASLPPVSGEEQGLDAGATWLRLSQEFQQDGFFQFSDPRVFFFPLGDFSVVFGEVTVTAGGRGGLVAVLFFDENGLLADVFEKASIVAGPRPICQATKLLDPDPIVRKMAEQALLYMGKPAKEYLDEQRAKASPELKEAIDRIWKRILEQDR